MIGRNAVANASGSYVIIIVGGVLKMFAHIVEPMLGQSGLGLCWDLAKTYRDGVIDQVQEAFYWRNLKHVKQVHLHDIRDGKAHRVIGTGCVDLMRFLPRLVAEAAVMEYTIEVRPREKAVRVLRTSSSYWFGEPAQP